MGNDEILWGFYRGMDETWLEMAEILEFEEKWVKKLEMVKILECYEEMAKKCLEIAKILEF